MNPLSLNTCYALDDVNISILLPSALKLDYSRLSSQFCFQLSAWEYLSTVLHSALLSTEIFEIIYGVHYISKSILIHHWEYHNEDFGLPITDFPHFSVGLLPCCIPVWIIDFTRDSSWRMSFPPWFMLCSSQRLLEHNRQGIYPGYNFRLSTSNYLTNIQVLPTLPSPTTTNVTWVASWFYIKKKKLDLFSINREIHFVHATQPVFYFGASSLPYRNAYLSESEYINDFRLSPEWVFLLEAIPSWIVSTFPISLKYSSQVWLLLSGLRLLSELLYFKICWAVFSITWQHLVFRNCLVVLNQLSCFSFSYDPIQGSSWGCLQLC